MSNVGFATLSVIPSAKGFGSNLDRQVSGPLAQSGEKAGGGFAKTFGKAAVAGLAVVGAGIAAFAVKSSAKFAEVGSEVTKLSRYTGLAAEDASRLRFAGKEAGIDIDVMTRSLGILSKNIAGKTLDKLGFSFKDAHGKAKPLNESLLAIAKRFQSMPNGIEKNALAMKLFGRSGQDLIPFLNKGADGIAELERQSDKFGETLSGKDLEAVKASTIAHREFHAVMEGLQIQVGRYVLPVFTSFVRFATTALLPAIGAVADLARKYLAPAFDFAFGLIGKVMARTVDFVSNVLVPGVKDGIARIVAVVTPFAEKGWAAFERIRKAIDDRLTPALRDRLMPVLRRVVQFIGNNLAPALAGVGAAGGLALASQIGGFAASLGGVIQTIAILPNAVTLAVIGVAALAAGFVYAYKHSEKFRKFVKDLRDELKDLTKDVKEAFDILTSGKIPADGPLSPNFALFLVSARNKLKDFTQGIKQAFDVLASGKMTDGPLSPSFLAGLASARNKIGEFAGYVRKEFGDLTDFVRSRWGAISEAIGHVMETVKVIVTVALNIIKALWRAWGDDLAHLAENVFGHIRDSIANALTVIRGIIDVVLSLINGDWGKAWDGIKTVLSGVWAEIRNVIGLALDVVKALIGGVLSTIAQVWNGIWSGISDKVSEAWSLVVLAVESGVKSVIDFITGLPGAIARVASGMWNSIGDGFAAVINGIVDIWNSLDFTAPSFSAFGHKVGGFTVGLPDLKHVGGPSKSKAPAKVDGRPGSQHLAEGGIGRSRFGGILATIAEGRHDEAVIPLSARGLAPFAQAMAPMLGKKDTGPTQFGPFHLTVQAVPGADGHKFGRDAIAEMTKEMRINPAFRAAVRDAVAAA